MPCFLGIMLCVPLIEDTDQNMNKAEQNLTKPNKMIRSCLDELKLDEG